ncbi:MAG: LCP family protein [Thermomicrobiales bacterium]
MHRTRSAIATVATIVALTALSAAVAQLTPLPREIQAAATRQDAAADPLTILLMGSDARPGEQIDQGVRPDALAVLHLDPASGSCRLLSIPRDTRVDVAGYGMTKINHALMVGGIPLQQQTVEQFLGIEVDHYGLIDFTGTQQLIDAIGGLTVTNDAAFTVGPMTFEAGTLTLDGPQALLYARYRGGPDGDFGRIQRQQDLIRAAIGQLADQSPADLITAVLPALNDHTRTDLSPAELISLAATHQGTCHAETIEMFILEGSVGVFFDPMFNVDLSYVVVDETEVRQKVAALTED